MGQTQQQAQPRRETVEPLRVATGPRKKPQFTRFRYELSKTKLRIPLVWVRHRALRQSDIILGAYPRSGSTWTRFTLFEILTGREADFDVVNATLRGVGSFERGMPVLPYGGRLIGTHEQYRREYKRAVYLVRDGRDVLLSEYAYLKALKFFDSDLDRFIERFLGKDGHRINGFGPWQNHVSSWLDSPLANTSNLLLVRFHELRNNPEEGFSRIADFLGVDVTSERIHQAVLNNSLSRMREKEKRSPQLPSQKDSFVRKGANQGWRGTLTESQLDLIERRAGSILLRLGYPSCTVSQESLLTRAGD